MGLPVSRGRTRLEARAAGAFRSEADARAALEQRYLDELEPSEISAWRMTIAHGYRFEATQALRQVLARAVVWGLLEVNPAKQGAENPQRRRTEKRPFESWEDLEALAGRLGHRLGPMVLFAAATGMRPGEWVALERRDIDRAGRVAYVNRSFSKGRLTSRRRPRRASAPCPYRLARFGRSTSWRRVVLATCSSRPNGAAT